uniref:Small integral membrane protein 22 n=1 Tax=Pipistrellus kuhlii TaxID=59472 RepID=A0A7J7YYQ8_PIPKU|nr:small integral membrane protein 22 [Pipistrellus kuhlii]
MTNLNDLETMAEEMLQKLKNQLLLSKWGDTYFIFLLIVLGILLLLLLISIKCCCYCCCCCRRRPTHPSRSQTTSANQNSTGLSSMALEP